MSYDYGLRADHDEERRIDAAMAAAACASHEVVVEGEGPYFWTCPCGDESGSFASYNDARDSAIDHVARAIKEAR